MVEGTFEMYKIETKRVQPPLKLLVYYQNLERKSDRDLQIYYSYSNQKPDETNCDGKVINASCLTIDAREGERGFQREQIYLKFETTRGCQANLKLVFPRQDIIDSKKRNPEDEEKDGTRSLAQRNKTQI